MLSISTMGYPSIKDQYYQELSRVTHAISNPKRMELIDVLSHGSHSVEALSKEIDRSVASTSQHLQVLKSARLVDTERKGNFMIYRIADDQVVRLVLAVKELGARKLSEIDKLIRDFKEDKNLLESITLEDLLSRSRRENIFLIDVRPQEEYRQGHIPQAISIPLSELPDRIRELPRNRTIVAYCRGPLCVMSAEAVQLLKKKSYKALRLEQGYVEWKWRKSRTRDLGA